MIESGWRKWALGVSALLVVLALTAVPAGADPASELSAAESRTAAAESDLAAAQGRLDEARVDYAAASRQARPVAADARAAQARAQELRERTLDRQRQARAEIAQAEESHRQEEEDHDDEVASGIGFGLALLVAAAIMFVWGRFRASPAVAALTRMQLGQAVALCVGGGFLVLVAGAVMGEGDGFGRALGMLLVGLAVILPIALLPARHSIEVERGNAKPVLGRERMPDWAPRAAALLLLLFGVVGLLGALGADEPEAPVISTELREEAKPIESGPEAGELEEAEAEAVKARKEAAAPLARQQAARSELQKATTAVRRVESRLVDAEADARRSERRLAALAAREEREAERQAEREAEEAEELEEIEEEFEFEEEAASGCDPNYSPCVPAYPPDVDCAEVGGSVSVIGSDPHGLDADGDGIGCE